MINKIKGEIFVVNPTINSINLYMILHGLFVLGPNLCNILSFPIVINMIYIKWPITQSNRILYGTYGIYKYSHYINCILMWR